ncbi:MAG: hypothetical protein NTV80_08545 [Verrucomicrobia bacterium]|nr:hypothetical protein [Verrucomicrobiota bacterium]
MHPNLIQHAAWSLIWLLAGCILFVFSFGITKKLLEPKQPRQKKENGVLRFIWVIFSCLFAFVATFFVVLHVCRATDLICHFWQNSQSIQVEQGLKKPPENENKTKGENIFESCLTFFTGLGFRRETEVESNDSEQQKISGRIESQDVIETYSAIFVGVFAIAGLFLQFQDIRDQQKTFRLTGLISFWGQQMETIRSSINTYLPSALKKGPRHKAADYRTLLNNYRLYCQKTGAKFDHEAVREINLLIARLRNAEEQSKQVENDLTDLKQQSKTS